MGTEDLYWNSRSDRRVSESRTFETARPYRSYPVRIMTVRETQREIKVSIDVMSNQALHVLSADL